MSYCAYCGSQLKDGENVCPNCGAARPNNAQFQNNGNNGGYPNQNGPYRQNPPYQQGYPYQANGYGNFQAPPPYPSGGLIAWSILSLLFCCRIGGIVALIYACGINSTYSYEQQRRKVSAARTWCIVSTALGLLAYLVFFFALLA